MSVKQACFILLMVCSMHAGAQFGGLRAGLYSSFNLGPARVNRHFGDDEEKSQFYSASLLTGHFIGPHLHAGVLVSGYFFEDVSDPADGENFANALGQLRCYPWRKHRVYLSAGYGGSQYFQKTTATPKEKIKGAVYLISIGNEVRSKRYPRVFGGLQGTFTQARFGGEVQNTVHGYSKRKLHTFEFSFFLAMD